MDKNLKILQWNIRGMRKNLLECKSLLRHSDPVAIAIQETKLKNTDPLSKIGNFNFYRKDKISQTIACGGVAVAVRCDMPHQVISVQTRLQAVVVQLHLKSFKLSICSIYLDGDEMFSPSELSALLMQIPKPFLILGDFNSHHTMWGSNHCDQRGKQLSSLLLFENLCLLNTRKNTYHSVHNNSFSAIDLSLSTPDIFPKLNWSTFSSTLSSDHFPIIVELPAQMVRFSRRSTWNIDKGNWQKFSENCHIHFNSLSETANANSLLEHVNDEILSAANISVPKTSPHPKRIPVPWWSEACAAALKERNRTFQKLKKNPIQANMISYKKARAKARRTLLTAKQTSWRSYITKINRFTPIGQVWKTIHKISGISHSVTPILSVNGETITSSEGVAKAFGEHFYTCFRNGNISADSREFGSRFFNDTFFHTDQDLFYNIPFSMTELKSALSKCKNTAQGPDDIHNKMLQTLSTSSLEHLLWFFNRIWLEGSFPDIWRHSFLIPILKKGKDIGDPSSYRPITLSSCLCKVMERMVSFRLMWFLESKNFLSSEQSGFRKNRSPMDNLIRIDTDARNCFLFKHHMIAVAFDLEKAYDTTVRFKVLENLHAMGIRGQLGCFIQNFLRNRSFQVRSGGSLSKKFVQEDGVLQGSVLSVPLFLVAINDILKSIPDGVNKALFADDLTIWCQSRNVASISRKLQLAINKLTSWTKSAGFKFSTSKTEAIHICRVRGCQDIPDLFLDGVKINFQTSLKILGITFDNRLRYDSHLKSLRDKTFKSLNILKTISRTQYGGDRKTMLLLYKNLVRSKLEYGTQCFGNASDRTLKILDPIHHAGIRLCTGAFRTSPVASVLAEAGEPPLSIRRHILNTNYSLKLSRFPQNPCYQCTMEPRYSEEYSRKSYTSLPFGIRCSKFLIDIKTPLDLLMNPEVCNISPWEICDPVVDTSLASIKKDKILPGKFLATALQHLEKFDKFVQIYTDGSKSDLGVGCSAVIPSHKEKLITLHRDASVFTAELYAILAALTLTLTLPDKKEFVIVSDSLSSLQAIQKLSPENQIAYRIRKHLHNLKKIGKKIHLLWVPGHIGIPGNESADRRANVAAKRTTNSSKLQLPMQDFKSVVRNHFIKNWQDSWNETVNNKLNFIKKSVQPWQSSNCSNRWEEVVLTRLRIGHCYVTHCHLLIGAPSPFCTQCQAVVNVKHILLDCPLYRRQRQQILGINPARLPSIRKVLGDPPSIAIDRVCSYLSAIRCKVVFNKY